MTSYFASPHDTYSTHVCAQISQTWSVKTVSYLIITWAFSSGPLTGSKSLSLSNFLSLLQLSDAAISSHLALQGRPSSRPTLGADLSHLSWSLISLSAAGGSEFCTIGVNIEPRANVHRVINPPSARCCGQLLWQEQKLKSKNLIL